MIFKKYRDIKHYIDSVYEHDKSIKPVRDYVDKALSDGFKLISYQFVQKKDYRIDVYGRIKPILGEMYDQAEEYLDKAGNAVSSHIVTFLGKRLPDGTYISPENIVFKIELTPFVRNEYQKLTAVELIEVNSLNDVRMF